MKLLLVTGRFPERSETFIYRKAVALARRGHDVTIATRGIGDWSLYPEPLPPTLKVEQLPRDGSLRDPRQLVPAATAALRHAARAPRAARRLYELCQERASGTFAHRLFIQHAPFLGRDVDLVQFEFLSIGTMYPLAREILGRPMVVSCRGNDVHTLELQPQVAREAAIECIHRADAIHCVSNEMASEVRRITGRQTGLYVNRPSVEVDRIAPRSPSPAGQPLHILATGRLVWKKGFDYLLGALARVARRGIDFRATILGTGELRSVMRFSIGDLGLTDRVTLGGAVTSAHVLEQMQASDVFVLSSVEEGISNAALEAMASGIPVITTKAGGMAEAVTDGVEGFVVDVRDVAALADRIERLAVDRDLRLAMGRSARARAVAEFSIARQADAFEELYRTLIGASP